MHRIAAFVLAGGKSSRMGQNKASLEFGGRTLAEHMLALVGEVVSDYGGTACLVGPAAELAVYGPVVEDEHLGQGPLGGIHAALSATCGGSAARCHFTSNPASKPSRKPSAGCENGVESPLNLMVAVDMPFLPAKFLRFLLATAGASAAVVTVPRLADGWQPLCAVYRTSFLPVAGRALAEGRNRVDRLFSEVPVQVVDAAMLAAHGFSTSIFQNLNSAADLAAARRRLKDTPVVSS